MVVHSLPRRSDEGRRGGRDYREAGDRGEDLGGGHWVLLGCYADGLKTFVVRIGVAVLLYKYWPSCDAFVYRGWVVM